MSTIAAATVRDRLEAYERERYGRMVLYMLAWDGHRTREPFGYEKRQQFRPSSRLPTGLVVPFSGRR